MFKRFLSIGFALLAAAPLAFAFEDVPQEHKHYLAIEHLREAEITQGYPDNTFHPEALINRAEVLKLILASAQAPLLDQPLPMTFDDVRSDDWFFPYVREAYRLEIVRGDGDGARFVPERPVNLAEYIKMLFTAHRVALPESRTDIDLYADVPAGAWFAPYLNYAAQLGLIQSNGHNRLHPESWLTRGEISHILYLFIIIQRGGDADFLLTQTDRQLAQVEVYMQSGRIASAQAAAELAADFANQSLNTLPDDPRSAGLTKLAEAYRLLIQAFVAGINGDLEQTRQLAAQVISTATEAWEADHDTQPLARHLKDRAAEILNEAEGTRVN